MKVAYKMQCNQDYLSKQQGEALLTFDLSAMKYDVDFSNGTASTDIDLTQFEFDLVGKPELLQYSSFSTIIKDGIVQLYKNLEDAISGTYDNSMEKRLNTSLNTFVSSLTSNMSYTLEYKGQSKAFQIGL